MLIKVGYDIAYEVWAPTPMVLMLYIHPSRAADIVKREHLTIEPEVPIEEFLDPFGNRCSRILAPPGEIRFTCEAMVADSGLPDPVKPDAVQHPVEDLPVDTLPYLLGSRYCEVEKLSETAWQLFGNTPRGWAKVQAVCDWVHNHVTFGYHFAREDKTAFEVFQEKQGVCRDFTHLAITLCRCLSLPARYVTGYLGDIGIPPVPGPMDFSAWFEVYLGGEWQTFDARHNCRRIGRIPMARGRDATDVALTTSFGKHALRRFDVRTDELPNKV
ncbi:MAG: transglutaminase-like domain-containing protein [Verrucomicrobiales bacterium]